MLFIQFDSILFAECNSLIQCKIKYMYSTRPKGSRAYLAWAVNEKEKEKNLKGYTKMKTKIT